MGQCYLFYIFPLFLFCRFKYKDKSMSWLFLELTKILKNKIIRLWQKVIKKNNKSINLFNSTYINRKYIFKIFFFWKIKENIYLKYVYFFLIQKFSKTGIKKQKNIKYSFSFSFCIFLIIFSFWKKEHILYPMGLLYFTICMR